MREGLTNSFMPMKIPATLLSAFQGALVGCDPRFSTKPSSTCCVKVGKLTPRRVSLVTAPDAAKSKQYVRVVLYSVTKKSAQVLPPKWLVWSFGV